MASYNLHRVIVATCVQIGAQVRETEIWILEKYSRNHYLNKIIVCYFDCYSYHIFWVQ